MTDQTDRADLEFIAPMLVTLTIDGKDLTITPLVLRELPSLLAIATQIFASLKGAGPGFVERMRDGTLTPEEVSMLITTVVACGDDYIALVALCARQTPEWVGGLLPDRAAELAAICLQVNADFFSRAMPILRAMASQARSGGAALAPSPTAPPSATPTPSSSS